MNNIDISKCLTIVPHIITDKITKIEVNYNGYGDEGNIDDIRVYTSSSKKEKDEELTNLFNDNYDYRNAIYDVVNTLLDRNHGGWEIDEGSYGICSINVKKRTAKFEHHENITETIDSEFEEEF